MWVTLSIVWLIKDLHVALTAPSNAPAAPFTRARYQARLAPRKAMIRGRPEDWPETAGWEPSCKG